MNNMKEKLRDYVEGRTRYTKMVNVALSEFPSIYEDLSNYIMTKIDIKEYPYWYGYPSNPCSIAIYFLTSHLDLDSLRKMFGDPILHNEFGEGFIGEYDKETDEYGESDIKESCASFFVNVGGLNLHFICDNRGTIEEVEFPNDMTIKFTREFQDKCLESLKEVVDLFVEKAESK
jgi:hypothetical protein